MAAAAGAKESAGRKQFGSGGRIHCPRWPRWLGQKICGWEDGQGIRRRLGEGKFSRFNLQELLCAGPDSGITWPQWHTLMFDGQETGDMRSVCPQNVKEMLLKTSQNGLLEKGRSQRRV